MNHDIVLFSVAYSYRILVNVTLLLVLLLCHLIYDCTFLLFKQMICRFFFRYLKVIYKYYIYYMPYLFFQFYILLLLILESLNLNLSELRWLICHKNWLKSWIINIMRNPEDICGFLKKVSYFFLHYFRSILIFISKLRS